MGWCRCSSPSDAPTRPDPERETLSAEPLLTRARHPRLRCWSWGRGLWRWAALGVLLRWVSLLCGCFPSPLCGHRARGFPGRAQAGAAPVILRKVFSRCCSPDAAAAQPVWLPAAGPCLRLWYERAGCVAGVTAPQWLRWTQCPQPERAAGLRGKGCARQLCGAARRRDGSLHGCLPAAHTVPQAPAQQGRVGGSDGQQDVLFLRGLWCPLWWGGAGCDGLRTASPQSRRQWYLAAHCSPALPFGCPSLCCGLAALISSFWLENTRFLTAAFAVIPPLMLLLFCVMVKLRLIRVLPILSVADEERKGLRNLLAVGEIAFYYWYGSSTFGGRDSAMCGRAAPSALPVPQGWRALPGDRREKSPGVPGRGRHQGRDALGGSSPGELPATGRVWSCPEHPSCSSRSSEGSGRQPPPRCSLGSVAPAGLGTGRGGCAALARLGWGLLWAPGGRVCPWPGSCPTPPPWARRGVWGKEI